MHQDEQFCASAELLSASSQVRSPRVNCWICSAQPTLFYKELSTQPSLIATVRYKITTAKNNPLFDLYTEDSHESLDQLCSYRNFGQMSNAKIHLNLTLNQKGCQSSFAVPELLECSGEVKILDYTPRIFSFSFGFSCHTPNALQLQNVSFEIEIIQQNITECIPFPPEERSCSLLFHRTLFPNLLGDESFAELYSGLRAAAAVLPPSSQDERQTDPLCYKYFGEAICLALYPNCDTKTGTILPICRETCTDGLNACSHLSVLESNFSKLFNCNYLPSVFGNIPCFNKNVTCGDPPEVPNAHLNTDYENGSSAAEINLNSTLVFPLHFELEYSCVGQTFQVDNSNTIRCEYSGNWSKPPKCLPKRNISGLMANVLPPVGAVLLIIVGSIVYTVARCKDKSNNHKCKRRKTYDAFVCYSYDEKDSDFAENTVRLALEENQNPPFKLCIHRRDFLAAWDIMWNIRNAIQNSNSAIIIMSQEYVNSLWCREEFEQCYMEHMKDKAFKLFVVMMQPADSLVNASEYMKSFFQQKTYLDHDDADKFDKIALYLKQVKMERQNKAEEIFVLDEHNKAVNATNV